MSISEYLGRTTRKAGKLATIAEEMALEGIDYVSFQRLAGELRAAGWSYKNTGRLRVWLAPGETALTVKLQRPANMIYVVGTAVAAYIEGKDEVKVKDLHAHLLAVIGLDVNNLANNSMELRCKRREWMLVKAEGGNHWKRISSVNA